MRHQLRNRAAQRDRVAVIAVGAQHTARRWRSAIEQQGVHLLDMLLVHGVLLELACIALVEPILEVVQLGT